MKRKLLYLSLLVVFLFATCGCGIIQCGISGTGDVNNTVNQDSGEGWIAALFVFIVLVLVLGCGMGIGGGQ